MAVEWTSQHAWETDETCTTIVGHRHHKVHQWGDAESFTEGWFDRLLDAEKRDFVVVGAGSPCQQLSGAGKFWEGLQGKDSKACWLFATAWGLIFRSCLRRNTPAPATLASTSP